MSVADRSIDPKILESAKREFLLYGFEKTSLKAICSSAGVTTGALYKRYKGKDDLFAEIVADTVKALEEIMKKRTSISVTELSDKELIGVWKMYESMHEWFELLNSHRDGFTLLVRCAEGSLYSNFKHDFVEKTTVGTYAYYQEGYKRGLFREAISKDEMHILLSAFWETVYEPFVHDFDWDKLEIHCATVSRLFNWQAMLGIKE